MTLLLAALVAWSVCLCGWTDAQLRWVYNKPSKVENLFYGPMRLGLLQDAHGSGIFLKFEDFYGPRIQLCCNLYFFAVYAIFPLPVLVANPHVVLNDAPQLVDANEIDPDPTALSNRGVDTIVTYRDDPHTIPFVVSIVPISSARRSAPLNSPLSRPN